MDPRAQAFAEAIAVVDGYLEGQPYAAVQMELRARLLAQAQRPAGSSISPDDPAPVQTSAGKVE